MFIPSFGQGATQITLSLNKQSYVSGDTVIISGTVTSPGASNSMILQVYSPDNILVQIGTVNISGGKFSTSVKAEGPSWNHDGSYVVKMIYVSPPINAVATANIDFKTTSTSNTISSQSSTTQSSNQTQTESLEEQIKKRIALANKLKEYLNGANSKIPSWMKDDARNWHNGNMDNIGFSKGIQYMISNGLVQIDWTVKPTDSFEHIPSWVKHVAGWWSQDMLSDSEYVNSIQYLLQHKIIETVK